MAASSSATTAPGATLAQKIKGCLVGLVTSDAAGMPVHWIYDKEKLREALEGFEEAPEFRPESRNPFYVLPTGRLSGYGDQALGVARYCQQVAEAASSGLPTFDRDAYAATVFKQFGPGTEYDPTATTEYHVDGTPSGRTKRYEASKHDKWPIHGPWLHHSLKDFNKAVVEGAAWPQGSTDDKQADAAAKIAPVVCLFAPHVQAARAAAKLEDEAVAMEALLTALDECSRTTQNDDTAVSAAKGIGLVLLEVLLGRTPMDAVSKAIASLRDSSRFRPLDTDEPIAKAFEDVCSEPVLSKPHGEVVATLGNTCKLPSSVQNPLHGAMSVQFRGELDSEAATQVFLRATRQALVATGCNCSRLCILGAILGAYYGIDCIPAEWVSKTFVAEEVGRVADSILSK